jgi:hypothetical protein
VEHIRKREFLELNGRGTQNYSLDTQDAYIPRQEPVFAEDNLVNVQLLGKLCDGCVENGLVDGQPAAPLVWFNERCFVCSARFAKHSRLPHCLHQYFEYRWVEICRLDGRRLLEDDPLLEAFGQQARALVGVFFCDVPTDRTTLIQDETVVVLELVLAQDQEAEGHTNNDGNLTERVHREMFGCFVLLSLHVDGDEFVWNLLLREGKCDDGSTARCLWPCVQFQHHTGI